MLDLVLWQTRPKITLPPERRSRARPARRIEVSVARISASYQRSAPPQRTPPLALGVAVSSGRADEGGPR